MIKKMMIAALTAMLAMLGTATAANAANVPVNLTSVKVTGPTGTVWNTTVDSYYTLFIQQPYGNPLNPNDQAINDPSTLGANNFALFGDGWPTAVNSTLNSDPYYNITLGFANGVSLTGTWVPTTGIFTAGNSVDANSIRYTLTGFGWQRIPGANFVSEFNAAPGGNGSDYVGAFSFSTLAVPEPVTWAMMILGMGMIGGSMRSRRRVAKFAVA